MLMIMREMPLAFRPRFVRGTCFNGSVHARALNWMGVTLIHIPATAERLIQNVIRNTEPELLALNGIEQRIRKEVDDATLRYEQQVQSLYDQLDDRSRERNRLYQENAELRHKLSYFEDIIRQHPADAVGAAGV